MGFASAFQQFQGKKVKPNQIVLPKEDNYGQARFEFLKKPERKDQVLICIDFSQVEIRFMAILAREPEMARVLSDPKGDIHQNTADKFGVSRDPDAKFLNFLLQYGGTEFMLSEQLTFLGVPTTVQQAAVHKQRYDEVYARVPAFRKELLEQHAQYGFVQNLTGRRRNLPGINWKSQYSVHQAETTLSNNVVQGSAQDQMKMAIVRCDTQCINPDKAYLDRVHPAGSHRDLVWRMALTLPKVRAFLTKTRCRWRLQIHDEVLFTADRSAMEEAAAMIARVMCWPHCFLPIVPYNVPIVADGGAGENWLQAKSKTERLCKVEAGFNVEELFQIPGE